MIWCIAALACVWLTLLFLRTQTYQWLRYRIKWRRHSAERARLAPRLLPYMRARKGDKVGQALRRAARVALERGKITARQAEYFGIFNRSRGVKR
jgi:hypothetical protein